MQQKVMLVTGCRSGIGLEISLAAAQKGFIVYAGLRDINTKETLTKRSQGLSIIPVQMDITVPQECEQVLRQIQSEHERLDVLVNNAGIGIGGFLEEISEEELRQLFEVNFFSLWRLSTQCIPHLRQSKGTLVMISSLSGHMALPGLGAYCASKFALEGLTETWRHELKPFGIDVISIQPGAYKTDISGANRRITPNQGTVHPLYKSMSNNMQEWYDKNAVAKALPPSHLAENLLLVLAQKHPKIRYPIGPSTGVRRLLMNWLPFSIIEGYFQRILTRKREQK